MDPKYYTQTVAITSKPEIPHSTFLIPAASLLSWAPHEEPLLEREGSCISLALCLSVCFWLSLSLSLSQPSFSPSLGLSTKISLTVILSVCDSLAPSIFLFLPLPVYLHLSYLFLLSSTVLCRPLSHSLFLPSCICLFISLYTSLGFLSPTDAVCLWLSFSLQDSYFASFSFVSPSLSPCVSPDIHAEIFSHVRYRFTTPARSPWPLNLIPSTKPHCFCVCLGLSVVCDCGYVVCMVCVFMHYKVEAGDF